MGLDQYLYAKKYVGGWEHSDETDRNLYNKIKKIMGLDKVVCQDSPSLTVKVTVAYWRKANAIHNFFVTNAQDGKDECQESYVSRELLQELIDACKTVIASKGTPEEQETIKENLEPTPGFFFGSTEINEWYFRDLQDTVETLEPLLSTPELKDFDFYYQASW